MRDGETVTIERLEVRLADLEKIKRALKLKDNAEACGKEWKWPPDSAINCPAAP